MNLVHNRSSTMHSATQPTAVVIATTCILERMKRQTDGGPNGMSGIKQVASRQMSLAIQNGIISYVAIGPRELSTQEAQVVERSTMQTGVEDISLSVERIFKLSPSHLVLPVLYYLHEFCRISSWW